MLLEFSLVAFSAGFVLLYLVATWQFDHWRKKGVPHLRPSPFTGNVGKAVCGQQQVHELLAEAYNAYPDAKVVGLWTLNKPALVIRDLNIAKHMLVKDFHSFPNRGFRADWDVEPQGARAMFALRDDAWRTVRTKLSPVFSSGKMKLMYPLIVDCCKDLVSIIKKERLLRNGVEGEGDANKLVMTISDVNSRLFIDIITSCAFGGVGRALSDPAGSVVYKILNGILNLNWKQGMGAFCMYFGPWPLYRVLCRLGFGFYDRRKLDLTSRLVEAELEQREVHGKTRNDLFGLSMQLRDLERQTGVPPHQSIFEGHYFTAIALQFLLAGSETSSSTLSFALYDLARLPEIQSRLRSNIRSTVVKYDGELSYDALHDMPYLDMVLNETLRLYPVLPFLDRICSVDNYIIPGTDIKIEKNTMVFFPIFSYHRDLTHFTDPLSYNPERWQSSEKDQLLNKDAFMPFGAGPRYCIGNRFAMDSIKAGLCHILLDYEVVLASDETMVNGLVFNRRSLNLNLDQPMRIMLCPLNQRQWTK